MILPVSLVFAGEVRDVMNEACSTTQLTVEAFAFEDKVPVVCDPLGMLPAVVGDEDRVRVPSLLPSCPSVLRFDMA